MERMGILEMAELARHSPIKGLRAPKDPEKLHVFTMLLANNFQIIEEGFTGVYMRDEECQIVPNELLPRIMEICLGGFDHAPEDHELHLFASPLTPAGSWMRHCIMQLMTDWMDRNI
jgi:hypothetical protein